MSTGWSQAHFGGAQWQDKGQWPQTGTQEFPSEREEKLPYREDSRALCREGVEFPSMEIFIILLDAFPYNLL